MRYRLGLDLGTASIGCAAFSMDEQGEPEKLIWFHERLFSEPLINDKGQLKPKKADRRLARQQRRQIDRRASRLRRVAHTARLIGIDPVQTDTSSFSNDVPFLRAKAARERIELNELFAVLMRMAKKRGYAGTLKVASKTGDAGVVASGSSVLTEEMDALARKKDVQSVTVGEYLYARVQYGLPARLKVAANNDYIAPKYPAFREYLGLPVREDGRHQLPNMYALRESLEAEFHQIWNVQKEFHPALKKEGVRDSLFAAIFYQRPLKSFEDKVGKCSLEVHLPRAPRAQMAAQDFRIEKQLADLRWGMGKNSETLSEEQKEVVRAILGKQREASFKAIYKALEKSGCSGPSGKGLNMDRAVLGGRDSLTGNTTLHAWRKLGLEGDWLGLDEVTQIQVINFLSGLGSPEQLDVDDWPSRFRGKSGKPRNFSRGFVSFIDKLRANDKFDRMSKMGFDAGRASYSVKALVRITKWLKYPSWEEMPNIPRVDEDAAIRECYPDHLSEDAEEAVGRLGLPSSTGNEVVDVALRQLRVIINNAIDANGGTPAQIVVELAREMKGGVTRRNDMERKSKRFSNERKEAAKRIAQAGKSPTPTLIKRYQLWEEQNHQCPYCESSLGISDALSGAHTNFEHILPRSLTQVGYKRSEIVLAHRDCNDEKGNRTPWQAFGERDDKRWQIIEARAEALRKKKSYRKANLLVMKDFEGEVLTDKSIAEFSDRQLHESSWLAKVATQWLSTLGSDVYVSRGSLTANLRRRWGLDTVIPQVRLETGLPLVDESGELISHEEFNRFRPQWEGHPVTRETRTDRRPDKRIDHRHHLIDAIVIALTSRSLYQRYANAWRIAEEERKNGSINVRVELPVPVPNIRDVALAAVRECRISHKPDRYPDGRFFQDTAYGLEKRMNPATGEPEEWLVKREPLTSLAPDKWSADKVRKNIDDIVGEGVRLHVRSVFERRVNSGMTPQQALREPIEFQGNILRKVRCYASKASDHVRIEHNSRQGLHYKYLLNDGYAYMELHVEAGGLVGNPNLVRPREGCKIKLHDTKEGVVRFYKSDTVENKNSGMRYVIHQIKAQGGGMLVMAPVTETRPVRDLDSKWGLKKVSGKGLLNFRPV
ncbi:type II CRISPR RNA-guided endonuclease Cas9 [Isoalcanivorax indicus]|uniref:type II CRISPR RNA-guided endonuclease Cas9 n=1 Tax=Isoalcanivorax indicus TaxID=2202653 RepID=UPI000DB97C4C|nr:type II CRISPR RNA-guided endonuclease Cas9 [Isoalcanivorax indicus]